MQERQKIFFVSAIVILAIIVLVEGVVLLRNSPRWHDWTASVSKTFRSLVSPTTPQTENALTGKEDIILQETAEDLEQIHNQINRLFYEMTKETAFPRPNLRSMDPAHDSRFPFENIRRLQSEIGRIFQMAHDSRHNGALNLIEQDWRDVGEISSVNLDEEGTNYVVTVSMPGFERTDINISLNGRLLIIEAGTEQQRAMRNSQTILAPAKLAPVHSEASERTETARLGGAFGEAWAAKPGSSGCFKMQIMLPNDITGESAQAFYENSILRIMVPRKPAGNSLARKVVIM